MNSTNGSENTKAPSVENKEKEKAEKSGATLSGSVDQNDDQAKDFDLDKPLEYAMNKIKSLGKEAGRSFEIDKMNEDQLIEEKVCVKRELRHFDLAFNAKYNKMVRTPFLSPSSLLVLSSSLLTPLSFPFLCLLPYFLPCPLALPPSFLFPLSCSPISPSHYSE